MLEDDNIFDREIKSILDEGREEVPDRVWDAVQSRISGKKRKSAVMWAGWAAVSAAAAVAAVLFLGPPSADKGQDIEVLPSGQGRILTETLAPSGPSDTGSTGEDTGQFVPQSVSDGMNQDSGYPAETQEQSPAPAELEDPQKPDLPAEPDSGTDSPIQETVNPGQEAVEPGQDTGTDRNEREDQLWPEDMLTAESGSARRQPKVAMTLFGNAISNNSDAGSGRSIAPMQSSGVIPTDEVRENQDTSYGIPVSFGVGAKIFFTERWALGAGVNCSFLTRRFSGVYYNHEGTAFADSDIRNTQTYVGIPVNVYFSIASGDFYDFYAYAGGTVEKCVSDTYLIDTPGSSITWRSKSPGVQMSAVAGIGVEFMLGNRIGLYIDPSLRYYFESRQPKSIRTVQPLMLNFEAGLRIRFR